MRSTAFVATLILGLLHITPRAQFEGFISASAGETVRSINYTDSPLTGIYHLGAKGSWSSEYWDTGLLFEAGLFNDYSAIGSTVEVKAHFELFKRMARLGYGTGLSFQSYYRGNYRRESEEIPGYTYRMVPMIVGQILVFEKAFLEYQKDFDTEIFWKVRIGWKFYEMKKE